MRHTFGVKKDVVIAAYLSLAEELCHPPSQNELLAAAEQGKFPGYHTVIKHFGTLNNLRVNATGSVSTQEELELQQDREIAINQIQMIAKALGRNPKQKRASFIYSP